jgi:putative ATPase
MGVPMPKLQKPWNSPLAAELRPLSLDEIVGQTHLLGEGKLLRKMADKREYQSTIFWGPAGTGKTSLVRALAHDTNSNFRPLNATKATVKDLRSIITFAEKSDERTFVFVDEIHRWNKSQQDVMLPVVEDGTIVLFGATTEKPKFAVNATLLSRCLVMEVKPLSYQELLCLVVKVKKHYKEKKDRKIHIDKDAAMLLVSRCSGDARKAITALETCIEVLTDDDTVAEEHVEVAIPEKHIVFDARGNDICRRMLITAFEDCSGNPFAASVAMAACYTTERTGLPECMIPMAQATVEMAMSRRNKAAYHAIKRAMHDVNNGETVHVPPGLRAGSVGYVHAISKTYLKGWCRDWEPIQRYDVDKNQTMFGIGIEHRPGEFGMLHGPSPDLEALLQIQGDDKHCVIQFRGGGEEPITDIIHRWKDEMWAACDD